MPRSSSAEPAKSSKRKGTRSVSTLTPSQLARKRANDREAQRAIRARTKEHIDRLERELDELRSSQSRDRTVRELLRRNKALEDELRRLKETMGVSVSMTSSPYSAPAGTDCTAAAHAHALVLCQSPQRLTPCPSVYDDNLSATGSGAMPSPQMSPLPASADYAPLPDYAHHQQPQQQQQYVPLPNNCETWASALPGNALPSSVPSPSSSSVNTTDEYGTPAAYIPTSMPAGMMPHGAGKEVKLEFEDMQMATQNYVQHQQHQQHQHQQQQQQQQQQQRQQHQQQQQRAHAWSVYPMYYDGSQHAACVSR
ncbi:Uncharacterized protein TPAR_05790 [Tolypocladium paradoxum]|uniref:BZIP domain-containing protein n=1 Tax=Tolypocladium paradoxum TaxID=94208 RepID=A0A2S4KV28_9HYPO|nr:Uncharacterized protein TPAR_05790 [Tolypocladium paradoxum]